MTHRLEGAEALSLTKAADNLIEECRMVLPGVQALFGFQLVAVFSERFDKALSAAEKMLHLGSIALVAVAIALIMTPAAYHRLTSPDRVTAHFIRLSTRLLMAGMPILMLALAMDSYIVGRLIGGPESPARSPPRCWCCSRRCGSHCRWRAACCDSTRR